MLSALLKQLRSKCTAVFASLAPDSESAEIDGFWEGGHDAYLEALTAEFEGKVQTLRDRLDSAEAPADRAEIVEEIRRETEAYEKNVDDSGEFLF